MNAPKSEKVCEGHAISLTVIHDLGAELDKVGSFKSHIYMY